MIWIFSGSLFITFFFVRGFAYLFHDMENYGTTFEKSNTLTGAIRKITGIDVHHFHIGIILLVIASIVLQMHGLNNILVILFGISLSLILDQLIPILDKKINYFSKKSFVIALIFHIITMIIFVTLYNYN